MTDKRVVLIYSNGAPSGTFVYDATGHKIEGNITNIEWSMEPGCLSKAVITFEDVGLQSPARVSMEPAEELI